MQLKTFMKLSGELTLEQMLEKLRAVAEPGELDKLVASTVGRHSIGENFPNARLQDLYDRASGGAVKAQDWVDLAREVRQQKQEGEAA